MNKQEINLFERLSSISDLACRFRLWSDECGRKKIGEISSLLNNTSSVYYLKRKLNAENLDFEDIKSWMFELPLNGSFVDVCWISDQVVATLDWVDFANNYSDLWNPSSEDIWVVSLNPKWIFELNHEEQFSLYELIEKD